MKVNVAGAGAGKTTKMADIITNYVIPDGKNIFCIAFTNAAVNNIKTKVTKEKGEIPQKIKISTIHSFLYQELIRPFYHFLYGNHFTRLSAINLPNDPKYRASKLSELEKKHILHFTKIPEKAKWIVMQKSGDRKKVKEVRRNVMEWFCSYCVAIFVDEAQDIDEDINAILNVLDAIGIEIILYGDPKQDVKGFGCFRQIIENAKEISYISNCYRCPQKHLDLSNLLASKLEKQVADKENATGNIRIMFESDIKDVGRYLNVGEYGLCYISRKNDRFATHYQQQRTNRFETLFHEVLQAIDRKWNGKKTDIEIRRKAYYVTETMIDDYVTLKKPNPLIAKWVTARVFDQLDKKQYAKMCAAIGEGNNQTFTTVFVQSIEIIKGLEASRCLFILTTDLAPYLFGKNTEENKIRHLLYVALTRSLDYLEFLVSQEVEEKYTRKYIVQFFSEHNMECSC